MQQLLILLISWIAPLIATDPAPSAPHHGAPAPAMVEATYQMAGRPNITMTVHSTDVDGEWTYEIEEDGRVVEEGTITHVLGAEHTIQSASSYGSLVMGTTGFTLIVIVGEHPGRVTRWDRVDDGSIRGAA